MNEIIIALVSITTLIGIVFSIWSINYSRKKYYDEFIKQREDRKNQKEKKYD